MMFSAAILSGSKSPLDLFPVVSLRSTTGYKLQSLRLKGGFEHHCRKDHKKMKCARLKQSTKSYHLRRMDDWSNLAQQVIKACFWFHPGILWVSKRLTIEREIACDDQALCAPETRKSYALFLTEFASRKTSREWAAAQAAWSNKSQLKERIDMILNSNRNSNPVVARARTVTTGTLAALLAAFALQSAPRLALANPLEEGKPETDSPPSADVTPKDVLKKVERDVFILTAPGEENEEITVIEKSDDGKEKKLILKAPKKVERAVRGSLTLTPAPQIAEVEAYPSSGLPVVRPAVPGGPRVEVRQLRRDDLEQRLDRLERMMEKMLDREMGQREKEKDVTMSFRGKPPGKNDYKTQTFEWSIDPASGEIDRNVKEVRRQHALADEQVKRVLEGQKSAMDAKLMAAHAEKQALQEHQKSLENQLRAIKQRLDSIDHRENSAREAAKAKEQKKTKEEKDKNSDNGKEKRQEEEKVRANEDNPPSAANPAEPQKF